jgi:putative endonuclease
MKYFVYILRTSSNTLYIGQTNNLEKRIEQHGNKKGAKYTRYFSSLELVYSESYDSRSEAMKREAELKKWPRQKKEELIAGNLKEDKCKQCGLCCRLFLINLNEKEYRSGKYKTQFEKFGLIDNFPKAAVCGANILKQKKDGSCIYLKGNKCSIHEARPQVCRGFFCNSKLKKYQGMIRQIEEKRT